MLYEHLQSCPPTAVHPAVVTSGATTTWSQLKSLSADLAHRWSHVAGQRVGLVLSPDARGIAALAALDRLNADAFLLDQRQPNEQTLATARQLRISHVLVPVAKPIPGNTSADDRFDEHVCGDPLPGTGQGSVTILTSGTEGRPKAARHGWETLARPVRIRRTESPPRWALTYRIHLYAGLQVVLQSLLNYGTLVAPEDRATPDDVVALWRDQHVQYASATPSYWRQLVLFADSAVLTQVPLRQITMGGEIADQQILDALRAAFPAARIAHIYATTELGRCFSVTDGRAGFPANWLAQPTTDGVVLKIEKGQLQVRSANAMYEYDVASRREPTSGVTAMPVSEVRGNTGPKWFATGDLVYQEHDRIYFAGRAGELINVGGNKVQPTEVERVIRGVAGVADVRVYGQPSSIAGQIVACDLVATAGQDPDVVRQAVLSACHDQLSNFHRPRLVQMVDQIRLNAAGKTQRR